MKIEIELDETLAFVVKDLAFEHGVTVPEEVVSLLTEYLGTPEEIRELSNDLQEMRSSLEQTREETSDFSAEVTRRINLLFHLDK
jgi:hypothetical protein